VLQDERPVATKRPQFSPQRYNETFVRDAHPSRYSVTSPTGPTGFGNGAYLGHPSGLPLSPTYDSLQTSSVIDNDLSLAIRGMVVEDEYSAGRPQINSSQSMPAHGPNPQMRLPHNPQTHHNPYGAYPPADYTQYYNGAGREPYMDYQYAYDAYRGPSDLPIYPSPGGVGATVNMYPNLSQQPLHHNAMVELQHRQQPGVFYDYVSRPPGSQFYYHAPQALIYPPSSHSSTLTPQLPHTNPATLADKKRELQA
jgi:hypothetical protein